VTDAEIADGSRCVFDANVLIYAEEGHSQRARDLLDRCVRRAVTGIVPFAALLEVCHKFMLIEARARNKISGSNPARKLAARPEVVKTLHAYQAKLDTLLDMGMRIEEHPIADYTRALELQSAYGLLTIDSVILAAALRVGADHLVTTDAAFRGVEGLQVVIIDDVVIPSTGPSASPASPRAD
jgi:predicted nucleic acid-binding protein